jgi:hypothetical protein
LIGEVESSNESSHAVVSPPPESVRSMKTCVADA